MNQGMRLNHKRMLRMRLHHGSSPRHANDEPGSWGAAWGAPKQPSHSACVTHGGMQGVVGLKAARTSPSRALACLKLPAGSSPRIIDAVCVYPPAWIG